jgi:hypothetical protein
METIDICRCPHCDRLCVKDDACNYVVCGRTDTGFKIGYGCGKPFCFLCGKKLCGQMYNEVTGEMIDSNEDHNHTTDEEQKIICSQNGYCLGGHNSHKQ